eukprot:935421-Alexandrium_andersonii.AAC.1
MCRTHASGASGSNVEAALWPAQFQVRTPGAVLHFPKLLEPARASQPHRTCAKRSLHMQTPAVLTTAMGTPRTKPPAVMAAVWPTP